ncbi:hypothetical protein TNCV_2600661 [Trichonephila clavipes]|nr:hypothetical protein TNCV_2600661 [Trichonephila clavipes]
MQQNKKVEPRNKSADMVGEQNIHSLDGRTLCLRRLLTQRLRQFSPRFKGYVTGQLEALSQKRNKSWEKKNSLFIGNNQKPSLDVMTTLGNGGFYCTCSEESQCLTFDCSDAFFFSRR